MAAPVIDVEAVDGGLYRLENAHGMRITLSRYGGSMVSWWCPDRDGRMRDVLLGWRSGHEYAHNTAYFGAIVGRWANRIASGRFTLDGHAYQLAVNDRGNHLHGGVHGFHQQAWRVSRDTECVVMTLRSPDGEAGFPGNLNVEVRYRLADDGTLSIDYLASCDAPTPINLTAHPYFNLNGGTGGIHDHLLQVHAERYLQVDASGIPRAMCDVAGTAFDLRMPARLGQRLALEEPELQAAGGFDHCYCIAPDGRPAQAMRAVARLTDPASGRCLDVASTEPGLQIYTGNYLTGILGRGDGPYAKHAGVCLEAQAFPDQPNGAAAEAAILRPCQLYRRTTSYRMSVLG